MNTEGAESQDVEGPKCLVPHLTPKKLGRVGLNFGERHFSAPIEWKRAHFFFLDSRHDPSYYGPSLRSKDRYGAPLWIHLKGIIQYQI